MSTNPREQRLPRVVIIGAGMSGLLVAIKLKQQGITDFSIIEKGAELGGTWRDNTYPGIACDVASHYYTYSFEPNATWSSRLPGGGEIQQYLQCVADKHDLRRAILFNREVVDARHDGQQWTVRTDDGATQTADIVVACCGLLHHPRYPSIEGLDDFAGECFHSARWNHAVALDGKRVGIIGNGSTGVQIISALAQRPLKLTVFQRSAQWIFPLPDRRYTRLEKGLLKRFPSIARGLHKSYRWLYENTFAKAVIRPCWQRALLSTMCRWNLRTVKDKRLRAKLTPSDPPLCKRMVMSTAFYPAMQRDNVSLVVDDIARIESDAVVTEDGARHPVDVLVLATGFDAHAYVRPLHLVNAAGQTLDEAWAEGPYAHRTVTVPGFPNFFLTLGPQSPIGNYSAIDIAETQVDYIMACVQHFMEGMASTFEARPEATAAFNAEIRGAMEGTTWVQGCNSWYIAPNGVPSAWPFEPRRFRTELDVPDLAEFTLR